MGNEAWAAMTEGDDLRAYLASDASSDDDSDEDIEHGGKEEKAKNMRALLGLGGTGDEDEDDFLQEDAGASDHNVDDDDDSFFGSGALDDDDDGEDDDGEEGAKEVTFIPGKSSLEEKIRSKLKEKEEVAQEPTPWEKYQNRRKEKRKEKKRIKKIEKAQFRGEGDDDDPFELDTAAKTSKNKSRDQKNKPSSKEELDLLLAGDHDEETAKDFHMRDLVRIEKNKSKKLRGSRKKKETEIRNNASGLDFQLDTKDSRFAAVLEGSDDRFGIDRTDPRFKETPAIKEKKIKKTVKIEIQRK